MKIAFVFDGLGYGGIERVGIDFVNICLKLGHEVDVYNLAPKYNAVVEQLPKEINYFPKNLSCKICPELYSYGVQKAWWGKYAYAILSPLITLAQTVKKVFSKKRKYDVAIAFSGHINDISFVVKNFVKADKKICWCHGNILSYFAICDAYPILYKKINKFVVLSLTGQKNIYPGHGFMCDKEILKIYNPTFIQNKLIDEKTVKDLRERYGDFILMVGRFADGKGHDTAIRTVKRLKENGLEKNIVFLGNGDTFDDMKQFAKEQGVDELCHFEGAKSNVADYIVASYVNLLTSRWEGLPTVIIEAMALGKPCVMTNSDDGEVSDGGKYCKLVPVDDINDLSIAITELYNDEKSYNKYVELSIERSKEFASEKIQEQVKSLLES